jgi:hypothetical protein
MSKDDRRVGEVVRESSTTRWGNMSARDHARMQRLATRSRDTSNTYLSPPMTWSELRQRYPSQSIDLRNILGEWRSFTTAQVVLDEVTHTPVVRGRGLTFDTNDLEPDPVLELPPRIGRVFIEIDRSSEAWNTLSPKQQARLERFEPAREIEPGDAGRDAGPDQDLQRSVR